MGLTQNYSKFRFWFGLVWFLICSSDLLKVKLSFQAQVLAFLPKHVNVGQKWQNNWFSYMFGFSWLLFSFGLAQITYLRPPSNSPALVNALLYPACYCEPKIGQNHCICYIFRFSLVWFGFGWVSFQNLNALAKLVQTILYNPKTVLYIQQY